jgi:hypothetical protein
VWAGDDDKDDDDRDDCKLMAFSLAKFTHTNTTATTNAQISIV